ncbi:hypothetical protein BIW22_21010 [Salmonella enterica]|nr:hypothetical protein [Salmonella enterica]
MTESIFGHPQLPPANFFGDYITTQKRLKQPATRKNISLYLGGFLRAPIDFPSGGFRRDITIMGISF